MNRFFWLCAGTTLLSALVSAFFSLLPLAGAPWADNVPLLYVASRSLALLAGTLVVVIRRSSPGLRILAGTMTLVQLFDVVPGLFVHDFAGPLVLAAANLTTLLLMRRPRA